MSEALQKATLDKAIGERLRHAVDGLLETWRGWAPAQQKRSAAIALMSVIVAGALLWWAWRPEWKLLYSGLAPDDTRQIASLLTAAGLTYDVSPDGTTLRVPAEMLDKARLATASKASGKSGRLGFEIFDKPNWAGSDFDEKVNYQRALEGELEHTIDTLTDVQSSRVHLVLPHDALFLEQQRDAKASVVLKLKSRGLSDAEAASVRDLVASAVDGLAPEHVVLVDAEGHTPLNGRNNGTDAKTAYEQLLSDRIVQTLEPVAGLGNVRATVTVDYDSSSSDEVDEKYDPASVVALSMQRSEQTAGQQAQPAGVPGTASNAPNQQPPLFPGRQPGTDSTKEESGTYGASKKTLHRTQGPGRLRRLTAAVLVNDRTLAPVSRKAALLQQSWTAGELKQFSSLAEAAIGSDTSRGDQVVVQNLRFENPAPPSAGLLPRILTNAAGAEPLLKYGTILLVFSALLVFVIRPLASGRPLRQAPAQSGAPALPAGAKAGKEMPVALPPDAPQLLFEQVADHIRRDPAQSARILQTWIKSE